MRLRVQPAAARQSQPLMATRAKEKNGNANLSEPVVVVCGVVVGCWLLDGWLNYTNRRIIDKRADLCELVSLIFV